MDQHMAASGRHGRRELLDRGNALIRRLGVADLPRQIAIAQPLGEHVDRPRDLRALRDVLDLAEISMAEIIPADHLPDRPGNPEQIAEYAAS